MLLAPSDAAQEQVLGEAMADEGSWATEDPISDLDRARSTLARQLSEAEPGRPPSDQLEQFIPVVMAAMPLIRTGVKIIGRDRIKNFVASQLATLIQGYVGPQAARALAPHVADAGLKLLSLEASPEQLGAEALVDTLQEAIADVMSLPAEALEDPLRLEAEIGDALGTAAVRHLPPAVLRDDLPGHDSDKPGWVAFPRTGKARRYRRSARRFDVSLTRARAGEIELPGAETLEERLLDAGVGTWPVSAEVQVFETMPGGHLEPHRCRRSRRRTHRRVRGAQPRHGRSASWQGSTGHPARGARSGGEALLPDGGSGQAGGTPSQPDRPTPASPAGPPRAARPRPRR